jgi:hypothetical protein
MIATLVMILSMTTTSSTKALLAAIVVTAATEPVSLWQRTAATATVEAEGWSQHQVTKTKRR